MLKMFQNKIEEGTEISVINMVAKGTSIQGNIQSSGDVRIDGVLLGNLSSNGKLVMGPGSEIKGDINVYSGKIGGIVTGNIITKSVLEVEKSARIEGTIQSNGLIIHEGADLKADILSKAKTIGQSNTTQTSNTQKKSAYHAKVASL